MTAFEYQSTKGVVKPMTAMVGGMRIDGPVIRLTKVEILSIARGL